jgi:hypothetical protein
MSASAAQACTAATARRAAINAQQASRLANGQLVLVESPYDDGVTTVADLDMRRKVEVLQYRAPGQAGTTALLMPRVVYPGVARLRYEQDAHECAEALMQQPSYSDQADVPGARVEFVYDTTMQLYNYKGTAAAAEQRATANLPPLNDS